MSEKNSQYLNKNSMVFYTRFYIILVKSDFEQKNKNLGSERNSDFTGLVVPFTLITEYVNILSEGMDICNTGVELTVLQWIIV